MLLPKRKISQLSAGYTCDFSLQKNLSCGPRRTSGIAICLWHLCSRQALPSFCYRSLSAYIRHTHLSGLANSRYYLPGDSSSTCRTLFRDRQIQSIATSRCSGDEQKRLLHPRHDLSATSNTGFDTTDGGAKFRAN